MFLQKQLNLRIISSFLIETEILKLLGLPTVKTPIYTASNKHIRNHKLVLLSVIAIITRGIHNIQSDSRGHKNEGQLWVRTVIQILEACGACFQDTRVYSPDCLR